MRAVRGLALSLAAVIVAVCLYEGSRALQSWPAAVVSRSYDVDPYQAKYQQLGHHTVLRDSSTVVVHTSRQEDV